MKRQKNRRHSRTVAYLLGAGFSYGIKHSAKISHAEISMPLQKSLFQVLCKYYSRKINRLKKVSTFIRTYFSPTSHRTGRAVGYKQHKDLFGLSIEEIVTFMQELAGDSDHQDKDSAIECSTILSSMTCELISHLSINGKPGQNKLLKQFVDKHITQTDVIVTFNWDTLIDRALENHSDKTNWNRMWGYGKTIRKASVDEISLPTPKKYPKLYKLHGSVNWRKNGEQGISITRKLWALGADFDEAFMMPPKMVKKEIFENGIYKDLWEEAEKRLVKCKKIVFIGYSFPPADYAVTNMLRRVIAMIKKNGGVSPKIIIVDPDVSNLSNRFESSFRLPVHPEDRYLSVQSYIAGERL